MNAVRSQAEVVSFHSSAAAMISCHASLVAAAQRADRGLAVQVGSVLAGLPGATERLAQLAWMILPAILCYGLMLWIMGFRRQHLIA